MSQDRQLVRLLSYAEHHVTRRLGKVLSAHNVSFPEWRVLALLSDGGGHPMNEIAGFALVPSPTLTRVIDSMVADNLVYRHVDDLDRRRVLVFAANRGQILYQRLQRYVEQYEQQLQEELDLETLTELLEQLIAITDLPEGAEPRRDRPAKVSRSRGGGRYVR